PVGLEDVKRRFVEEVKLRGYDDQYIDIGEEKQILQIAIKEGVGVDSARGALVQVCESLSYVLESQALSSVKKVLETFAENDGVISEKEFNDSVTICKKECRGKRSDIQAKRMIIDIIEENSWKLKQGFMHHWYDKVKKE